MTAKPRTATAIRFAPEVHEALVAAAEERGLSINYLVQRLIPANEWRLTR